MEDITKSNSIQEVKENVEHLESILPNITDKHEYEGTLEVIHRLESRLECLEDAEEEKRRDEKRGTYPEEWDDCN